MYPLASQEESTQLEQEIRQAFLEVFDEFLGEKMRILLQLGSPYLIENQAMLNKILNNEMLLISKAQNEIPTLQYLLKAWKGENKKRGLFFLKTYLQLLYPNKFQLNQLWQETGATYPTLKTSEEVSASGKSHWLTSRIRVEVTDWSEDGDDLASYKQTMQAIIGARFVLELAILREFGASEPNTLVFANGASLENVHEAEFIFKA